MQCTRLHDLMDFHYYTGHSDSISPPANTIRVNQQQWRQNCGSEIKRGESLFNTTPNEIWWCLISLQAFLLDHQQLWNLLKYLYGTAFHLTLSFSGNHLCIIYWIHLRAAYSRPTIYGFAIVLRVTHMYNCISIINPLGKNPTLLLESLCHKSYWIILISSRNS